MKNSRNTNLLFLLFSFLFFALLTTDCKQEDQDTDLTLKDERTNLIVNPPTPIQGSDHGKVFAPEKSGNTLTKLNPGGLNFKIYQHRSPWSPDKRWMIFVSSRDPEQGYNYFAMNMPTVVDDGVTDYTIIQLTDHKGIKDDPHSTIDIALSRKYVNGQPNYVLYYTLEYGPLTGSSNKSVVIVELDYGKLIDDALAGTVKPTWHYDRLVSNLSWNNPQVRGGISLDASEHHIYMGIEHGPCNYNIFKVDINSGTETVIHNSNQFAIDHIQANPYTPNLLSFNQAPGSSTGSPCQNNYTPERLVYTIYGDGSGLKWIFPVLTKSMTHSTWTGPSTIGFNLVSDITTEFLGTTYTLYNKGVYDIDVNTNVHTFITDYHLPTSNPYIYNHHSYHPGSDSYILDATNPVPSSEYNTKELWKYEASTGAFTLLSLNHGGTHAHQSISDDGRFVLYQERHGENHQLGMIIFP